MSLWAFVCGFRDVCQITAHRSYSTSALIDILCDIFPSPKLFSIHSYLSSLFLHVRTNMCSLHLIVSHKLKPVTMFSFYSLRVNILFLLDIRPWAHRTSDVFFFGWDCQVQVGSYHILKRGALLFPCVRINLRQVYSLWSPSKVDTWTTVIQPTRACFHRSPEPLHINVTYDRYAGEDLLDSFSV